MVGKKGLLELKKCTVSGLKRQFDKWHLFSAPTGGAGGGKALTTLKSYIDIIGMVSQGDGFWFHVEFVADPQTAESSSAIEQEMLLQRFNVHTFEPFHSHKGFHRRVFVACLKIMAFKGDFS